MNLKKSGAALLCAVLAVPVLVPAPVRAAEVPEVIYDGEEKEFTLENVSGKDLFPEFKGMMPGDVAEQQIKIRVENTEDPVTVFLAAENSDEADRALFQDVVLRVEAGGKLLSESPLSEDSGLEAGVELFTFNSPGEQTLDVTLAVAPEAGNELMDAMTSVRWTFTVQDYDNGDGGQGSGLEDDLKAAQTGDTTSVLPWAAGAVACGGIAAGTVFLKRKNKNE